MPTTNNVITNKNSTALSFAALFIFLPEKINDYQLKSISASGKKYTSVLSK